MTTPEGDPVFFEDGAAFGAWLEAHHERADVLWVGYWKKATGRASLSWTESVREALRFGWIDGLRKSLDDERYTIRFTPRRPRSHWSARNVRMVEELLAAGRMAPAGVAAWEARDPTRTARASYEREPVELDPAYEARLREDAAAWAYFQALPPGYTRTSVQWVMGARREETRLRRLETLLRSCAEGRRIPPLR